MIAKIGMVLVLSLVTLFATVALAQTPYLPYLSSCINDSQTVEVRENNGHVSFNGVPSVLIIRGYDPIP